MLTAKKVKEYARSRGADLVGIASVERFQNAPAQMNPVNIFPETKSIIVFGMRIPRGCYRGIYEGTYFASYMLYGYKRIDMGLRPLISYEIARFIENYGWEAIPLCSTSPEGQPWREPVEKGKIAPDVALHFRISAVAAGLGEIGYSKVFLSPEFGPRQRFGIVLTDAELEPDPLFNGQICDRCKSCIRECPGALSEDKIIKINIAGKDYEWADIHTGRCHLAHHGGSKEVSPFLAKVFPGLEIDIEKQDMKWGKEVGNFVQGLGEMIPFHRRMWNQVRGYWAFCGARGCIQACLDHLEKTGRIRSKFHTPLRKRNPWWSRN